VASILVVEDHRDSAEFLITALRRVGHTVAHAPDGREALDAVTLHPPDLIVLDLRLPALDGISLLQVLRSYMRWRDIPVIVVSAGTDVELTRVTQLGARRVFRKAGFQITDFLAAVDDALASPSNHRGA
jgi:CheY-like chemotaxis protein